MAKRVGAEDGKRLRQARVGRDGPRPCVLPPGLSLAVDRAVRVRVLSRGEIRGIGRRVERAQLLDLVASQGCGCGQASAGAVCTNGRHAVGGEPGRHDEADDENEERADHIPEDGDA